MTSRGRLARRGRVLALAAVGLLALGACSSGGQEAGESGESTPERLVITPADGEGGHTHGEQVGDGTRPEAGGYRLADLTVPAPGAPGDLSFRVLDADGEPLLDYLDEQTKPLHLYVVRDDLAQFRHLHPTMADDGTWTARLDLAEPGDYRVVAELTPDTGEEQVDHVVLGQTVAVRGPWTPEPVPDGAVADDGVVEVAIDEQMPSGTNGSMEVQVSDGEGAPVSLGSYLGAYAHLTGFDTRTGAFVHAHPMGEPTPGDAGSTLTFHTEFEQPGRYRFFVQVRVDGFVHTLPVTAEVVGV